MVTLSSEKIRNINEDSLFFAQMPPASQLGVGLVAFEINGKPYVYPYYAFPDSHFHSSWKNKEFTFQIDKIDSVSKYISGRFSGPIIAEKDSTRSVTFFDVEYR